MSKPTKNANLQETAEIHPATNSSNPSEIIKNSLEYWQRIAREGYEKVQQQSFLKTATQVAIAINAVAEVTPSLLTNSENEALKNSLENFQKQVTLTTANAMFGALAASSIANSLGLDQQAKGVSAIGGAIIANIPAIEEAEALRIGEVIAQRNLRKRISVKILQFEVLQKLNDQQSILNSLALHVENGDENISFEQLKKLETLFPEEAKDLIKEFELTETKKTLLHLAANGNNLKITDRLISLGCDINKVDNLGATPLYYAARNGHSEAVEKLTAVVGADINKGDKNGITPLHFAILKGHLEVVEELIASGADFDKATKNEGLTPLHIAARNSHSEVVEKLIASGADFNKGDKNGATPLHFAAEKGHKEIVEKLIAAGADINEATKNEGLTPLHIAARNGHSEVVEKLIASGAKTDIKLSIPPFYTAKDLAKNNPKIIRIFEEEEKRRELEKKTPLKNQKLQIRKLSRS
jgi:ankyrin repeat protein